MSLKKPNHSQTTFSCSLCNSSSSFHNSSTSFHKALIMTISLWSLSTATATSHSTAPNTSSLLSVSYDSDSTVIQTSSKATDLPFPSPFLDIRIPFTKQVNFLPWQ